MTRCATMEPARARSSAASCCPSRPSASKDPQRRCGAKLTHVDPKAPHHLTCTPAQPATRHDLGARCGIQESVKPLPRQRQNIKRGSPTAPEPKEIKRNSLGEAFSAQGLAQSLGGSGFCGDRSRGRTGCHSDAIPRLASVGGGSAFGRRRGRGAGGAGARGRLREAGPHRRPRAPGSLFAPAAGVLLWRPDGRSTSDAGARRPRPSRSKGSLPSLCGLAAGPSSATRAGAVQPGAGSGARLGPRARSVLGAVVRRPRRPGGRRLARVAQRMQWPSERKSVIQKMPGFLN